MTIPRSRSCILLMFPNFSREIEQSIKIKLLLKKHFLVLTVYEIVRKILSISFALLIVLSSMHFTLATHFCEGKIAAVKVSFSGELASCGMETGKDSQLPGVNLREHCCDNHDSVLEVDKNFAPSFSEFKAFSQPILLVFDIPVSIALNSLTSLDNSNISISSPDNILVEDVSLPKICVFRI